jgi:hypothetical protein
MTFVIGIFISFFISHRGHLAAGLFMGWFYGDATVGSYASLKKALLLI